ncbi:PREDICTED: leucine-rich repeat extensin-like protein 2 [Dipodomys ordii]|uniref:Leucine-rich repeat extensin-like protein 2 n=1 Tax=Dipodomys ordii TaxID=10020 RepID=A0A1S3F871_DIPOR|nr:PREDICTED: leucine-rich repeat extensin-like protein 2 [Dipodomys ordii]
MAAAPPNTYLEDPSPKLRLGGQRLSGGRTSPTSPPPSAGNSRDRDPRRRGALGGGSLDGIWVPDYRTVGGGDGPGSSGPARPPRPGGPRAPPGSVPPAPPLSHLVSPARAAAAAATYARRSRGWSFKPRFPGARLGPARSLMAPVAANHALPPPPPPPPSPQRVLQRSSPPRPKGSDGQSVGLWAQPAPITSNPAPPSIITSSRSPDLWFSETPRRHRQTPEMLRGARRCPIPLPSPELDPWAIVAVV